MTIYLSGPPRRVVMRYQELLDIHIPDCATGRCLACRLDPCPQREEAMAFFQRHYAELPQRRPGASRPELVGARRVLTPPAHRVERVRRWRGDEGDHAHQLGQPQ